MEALTSKVELTTLEASLVLAGLAEIRSREAAKDTPQQIYVIIGACDKVIEKITKGYNNIPFNPTTTG